MDTSFIVGKLVLMADVVARIVLAYLMPKICVRCSCHLSMVIVWQMESHSGRCYDHVHWVISKWYYHCGRWNSHIDGMILIMADVVTFVAGGIATGSIVLFIIFYFILF